ncbi:hypothetical protein HZH68_007159 [Vespula germanica]|uniref:Uncharacterized protein n=1 Tax=Vespula germanica TaxID=30212 RepID=A0A834KAI8_VESGE|nr:hypothetical protein HZH68_007159 [Vespula germanica]
MWGSKRRLRMVGRREASLESGLSPGTPVLVNHCDPPTPVPYPPAPKLPKERCDMTINEVKGGTDSNWFKEFRIVDRYLLIKRVCGLINVDG